MDHLDPLHIASIKVDRASIHISKASAQFADKEYEAFGSHSLGPRVEG